MKDRIMRLFVLGTGPSQMDLIKLAKQYGMKIYACSSRQGDIAEKFADEFIQIDIADIEKVIDYAKSNSIDTIYSVGSDFGIYTAHVISKRLNLPLFNALLNYNFIDKINQKNLLKNYLNDIEFLEVKDFKDLMDWNSFPCVIKPADSQGQRGVYFINNQSDLESAFKISLNYSKSKRVLLEKFIEGQEYSVNGYLVNSKIVFLFTTERESLGPIHSWKPYRHKISKQIIELGNKYKHDFEEILKNLKFTNGPFYAQFKLNGVKINLFEITPRLDGCHIWRLIYLSTGINLLQITLNHLINKKEPDFLDKFDCKPLAITFFYQYSDTYFKEPDLSDNTIYAENYYNQGDLITGEIDQLQKTSYKIKKI
jgi:biotin carboxylase